MSREGKQHGHGNDGGGWQLVVRRHGGRGVWSSRADVAIHSVFMDNIPEFMGTRGLYNIFSNYGVVMDAFIPNKRGKMTRSRFGCVRYNCSVAADMAVQKAHGLWCDDRALKVKMAEFEKVFGPKARSRQVPQTRMAANESLMVTAGYQRTRSFAEVVRGRGIQTATVRTIHTVEEGNGWLYESIVARLKPSFSVVDFKEEIVREGFGDVKVRLGGGRDMVLTFTSVEDMKVKFQEMQEWLNAWCESAHVWRLGLVLEQERHVWLSCYGVPLNLWSFSTFSSIGKIWGAVDAIDDDTLRLNSFHCGKVRIATTSMDTINHTINLECKGTIYPVRVCEEQIIVSKTLQDQCVCQSNKWKNGVGSSLEASAEAQITDKSSRYEEEDDDVEVQMDKKSDLRGEVEVQLGKKSDSRGDVAGVGTIVSPILADALDGDDRLRDVSVVVETDMMKEMSTEGGARINQLAEVGTSCKQCGDNARRRVDGDVYTPGFIRSLSGSESNRLGIHLEMAFDGAQMVGGLVGSAQRIEGPAQLDKSNFQDPITFLGGLDQCANRNTVGPKSFLAHTSTASVSPARKEKMKGKALPVSTKQFQKQQMKGKFDVSTGLGASSLNLRKGAVFRSAVVAISLSMASGNSRGRRLLTEAEASIQIGKALGLECEGKEEEVLSKLHDLEAQDKQRARPGEGDVS
ncbi:hypothetical protein CsSME_00020718 [Camellia sinensis var. sinensis]